MGTERKPWTGYCEITSTLARRQEKKEKKNWRGSLPGDRGKDHWATIARSIVELCVDGYRSWRGSQTASFVILAPITRATSSRDCKSLSFPATRAPMIVLQARLA